MALDRVRVALGGIGFLWALTLGCVVSPNTFACSDDATCSGGRCEINGYCSFPADDCPSGQRYGDLSGPFSGECVPTFGATETTETADPTTTTDTADVTNTTDAAETTGPSDPTDAADATGSTDATGATNLTDSTGPFDPTEPMDPTGPDGSDCTASERCASGACYITSIGSICGECASDDDCEGGCTPPNPLSEPATGSVCNMGLLGDGCESSDVCSTGLSCVEIVNVPGILTASTCSQCDTSADCSDGLLCNVSIDVASISGEQTCVAPTSIVNGEFCDLEGDGNEACENFCAAASVKGLLVFGVCGECRIVEGMDEGCAEGLSCVEPEIGLDGTVVASHCG